MTRPPVQFVTSLSIVLLRIWAQALCLVCLGALSVNIVTAEAATGEFANAMQAASQARQVPLPVVEATAYVNTRWEWIAQPAHDGGVGPMKVTSSEMALASQLSGRTEAQIKGELASNLDAGAALLAYYHATGGDLTSWYTAVATTQGPEVAKEIFTVMRSGARRTTSAGETLTLSPQPISAGTTGGAASIDTAVTASPDYPSASWIPADPSNYSTANRAHDHTIDMIVIHDIEGSAASGIQDFETPNWAGSAHYVVGYDGSVTQMVREHDIAWHAGNWDYNTRSIGIEHAGFAWTPGLYTTAEYNASAALAASICSRYGVPMDRTHVIGHSEVPDPNNPGLFGGSDHHTDPGPYWDWTYYMATAQADAAALPSPPHLMPNPVAVNTANSATVTWAPARSCRKPITGYVVTSQPDSVTMTLPATATSTTFTNLTVGTRYTFTVTAQDADGQDSQVTNSVVPGACRNAGLTATPATPQIVGTTVKFTATSAICANPRYEFWMLPPGGVWTDVQPYSPGAVFTWNTTGLAYGTYSFGVWARDSTSPGVSSNSAGAFDTRFGLDYRLNAVPCASTAVSAAPGSPTMRGTSVTVTASTTGCSKPLYQFWLKDPSGAWNIVQPYSTTPTFAWSSSALGAGPYLFSVWTRDVGSPSSYDSYNTLSYSLTAGCPSETASASPISSASVGTTVTLTASATGCPNPRYEYWILPPGGTWTLLQPYASSAAFAWSTAGMPSGAYLFSMWVRDANSPASYDAFATVSYTLNTTACASVNATPSPSSPSSVNTTINVALGASGCPNPLYQVWMLPPGGAWQVVQPYASGTSFGWKTAGKPAGTYLFSIWGRDASSGAAYDAYTTFQYQLTVTPCTGATASVVPSTASAGTQVTINATAIGCSSPLFEYWVLPPGGTWTLIQGYTSGGSFVWGTAGAAKGSYLFSVWVRDASGPGANGTAPNTYDAYATATLTLM